MELSRGESSIVRRESVYSRNHTATLIRKIEEGPTHDSRFTTHVTFDVRTLYSMLPFCFVPATFHKFFGHDFEPSQC